MDNITHGLIGYALTRTGTDPESRPAVRRARVWTGIVASNLPDADVLIRRWLHDPQLAYLMQHRGWTHTLLVALPLGVLTALACSLLFKVRERGERIACCWLGAGSGLLHVGFDFLNNYGVHPFSPFDDHWFYGDSVFIIEPLLLAALLPLLAWHGFSKWARGFGFLIALLLVALIWTRAEAPLATAIGITLVLGVSFALQRRLQRPAWVALAASALVVAMFAGGSRLARSQALDALARAAPSERALDAVLTPAPGNPLCFSALLLSTDPAGFYRARYASVALGPFPLAKCRLMPAGPITAPLQPTAASPRAGVRFDALFSAEVGQLRALAAAHCDARVLLRFIRAPFWLHRPPHTILGDLRYDSSPALDFTERALNDHCPDAPPRWIPPRRDLVGE